MANNDCLTVPYLDRENPRIAFLAFSTIFCFLALFGGFKIWFSETGLSSVVVPFLGAFLFTLIYSYTLFYFLIERLKSEYSRVKADDKIDYLLSNEIASKEEIKKSIDDNDGEFSAYAYWEFVVKHQNKKNIASRQEAAEKRKKQRYPQIYDETK